MFLIKVEYFILLMVSYQLLVSCQRSPYAGGRPSGYKDRLRPKQNNSETTTSADGIVNRFGNADATQKPPQGVPVVYGEVAPLPTITNRVEGPSVTTGPEIQQAAGSSTSRLPYDAYGDAELVNMLNRLPLDQRPFWFINYQAIEAHRNSTPTNLNTIASRSSFLGK